MNIYFVASQDGKVFGWGQTTRSFNERHKDGDWAKFHNYLKARGEELVLLGWWEDVNILDTDIHKFLLTLPHIRKYAEWFSHKTTLDIIKNQVEQKFFSETPEKKDTLKLFKHQQEFVTQAQADYLEFLLFAKCRAGKSVMTLSHIVDKGFKATLVVSRYTSPRQSWGDDSSNFSNFSNIVFIDLNDSDYLKQLTYWYNTDKQIILWACVQSRKTLNLPIDIDLLVYDEAHIGYNSKQWNKLREATNCPVLYVTGTAYKMVWDFDSARRFIYSYFEEQLDKKNGLNDRPSMQVLLAIYESELYQKLFGSDPDAMKNIFRVDDEGNFVEPALVQEFVTNYFGTQRNLRPKDRLLKNSTHMYITLPSVAACYAMAELLKSTRFAPLVATGDANVDADDINKHIAENSNGSCILTRTANVLGVTARDVDTIINCAEGSSIEFWTQFAFRGGSGDHDWQVIDFCPQRCLESLRSAYTSACELSPHIQDYEFTDYVSIIEWNGGFNELSADRVIEILAADVGNAVRLISGVSIDLEKLNELDFGLELQASSSDSKVKEEIVNDNGANGKSNKKLLSQVDKDIEKTCCKNYTTVKEILKRVSIVLYHAIKSGQPMNSIDAVLSSEHYQPVTLDRENILRNALDNKCINQKTLSMCISGAYVDIQHAIKKDERRALHDLAHSAQQYMSIPVDCMDNMFADL